MQKREIWTGEKPSAAGGGTPSSAELIDANIDRSDRGADNIHGKGIGCDGPAMGG